MSARRELARRVLQWVKEGQSVPTYDAIQVRNSALHPEDMTLSLEEIASRILSQEENSNSKTAEQG
jgi:hypothetical protein